MSLLKALRQLAFGALLAASAAAALLPDWATTLKAQNYAYYVDLHLALDANSAVARAGETLRVVASVYNGGPADAHDVRNDTRLPLSGFGVTTLGCTADPIGYPQCRFGAPLAAEASATEVLLIDVAPVARGTLELRMNTGADEPDAYPGQEFAELLLPIEAHVNLGTELHCARRVVARTQALPCYVVVRNAGPASALQADVQLNVHGAVLANVACSGSNPRACPGTNLTGAGWSMRELRAGDAVRVDFTLTLPVDYAADSYTLTAGAHRHIGEIEDEPSDDERTLAIEVPIFADDFETPPN